MVVLLAVRTVEWTELYSVDYSVVYVFVMDKIVMIGFVRGKR